jgi:hypothetical protein
MPSEAAKFTYPIMCCPMGDVREQDWDLLPVEHLQTLASCAIYGNSTYGVVSLSITLCMQENHSGYRSKLV